MEMLQLRYFYESAANGSFAKTAQHHMVPTTSVSASVRRLEKELGCELFDRSCNRIFLNANGRHLQQSLCTVFSELDEVVGRLSSEEDGRELRLLVRAMRRRVTDRVIAFRQRDPRVNFRTAFDFSETDYDSYDIIVDTQSDAYEGYEHFVLYSMELCLKCVETDPLCQQKLTLKQLSGHPFVSMGEGSNLHRILLRACARAGFVPDVAVACNDIECYEKFIASGMGIALGRKREEEPGIKYLDVTDLEERYTVCVYYRKSACYGNVERFLDFLRDDEQ